MADTYVSTTLKEIVTYYQANLQRSFYAFESRNQGREIVLIPYGGSWSDFAGDQNYVIRTQAYCQDATHSDCYNMAFTFYETFKNNYLSISPTTYRIHYVRALDQPGPVAKVKDGIFWTTLNFEINIVII